MMNRLAITVAVAMLAVVVSSMAAINSGTAVTTLPDPDATGAYVFGNANYTTTDFTDNQLAAGLAYPVWEEIGVPAGSTVKFIGGVALSSLPDDCTFDFSACTYLFVMDASVFGSGFTIHENMNALFIPCTVSVSGTTAAFTRSSYTGTVNAPVTIAGQYYIGRDAADSVFNGTVSGADTGSIMLRGFTRKATFNGTLDFPGKIVLGSTQRGQRINVNSPAAESLIGHFEGFDYGYDRQDQARGAPQQLSYTPASETPSTLVITNFDQHETGGLISKSDGLGNYRRHGVLLCTCSNNTIRIENVANHGAIHLLACSDGFYTFGNEPAFDEGFGNFEFVNLGRDANHPEWAQRKNTFYPSPNVNLRFTGNFTGNIGIRFPSFNYTAESNVVNRGTLDMSEAYAYEYARQPIRITGYSPWNLPRSIKCHPHLAATTTNIVTDTRWLMPLDFGADADEIDVARCETDAILSVPAAGTVVVSNATTSAEARPIPGRYPVITGSSGGANLANWTLELAGARWGAAIVTLESDDTGMWINVEVPNGSVLTLR